MKKIVIALILTGIAALGFSQEDRPATNEDVTQLFEVMDTKSTGLQTFDAIMTQMLQMFPTVPSDFLNSFRENLDFGSLVEAFIPIYAKYYTHNEVMQLIEFYQSPIGRKSVEVTPAIAQESMSVSMEWAMRISEQMIEAMTEKGYIGQ
jgi:hypothetical protein